MKRNNWVNETGEKQKKKKKKPKKGRGEKRTRVCPCGRNRIPYGVPICRECRHNK